MPHESNPLTQALPIIELVNAATVAKALNVDKSTVTRMAKTGQIPAVGKLPGPLGAYVFSASAVEDLARGREAGK